MQYDGTNLEMIKVKSPSQKYQYKKQKYFNEITETINNENLMNKWLNSEDLQGKMAYKTLKFLIRSGINPEHPKGKTNDGFSESFRTNIIKNWIKRPNKTLYLNIKYGSDKANVKLIKDVLGVWTTDRITKEIYLKEIDCISSFDIEHVVSNSYGADNNDLSNGVLLDSRVNRRKNNNMLFLVDLKMINFIKKLKKEQEKYIKSVTPWYKRLWLKI